MEPEEKKKRPLFGTALILAGGQSSRMGFDKQTLQLEGQPLAIHIAKELKRIFPQILIVSQRPDLYEAWLDQLPGLALMSDIYPGQGPMSGIHAGLLQAESPFVYVTGCDMPRVSPDLILHMMTRLRTSQDHPVGAMLRRESGHLEPLNAFYAKGLAPLMEARLKARQSGLQAFCRDQAFVWLTEEELALRDPGFESFEDYNQPSDLDGRPLTFDPGDFNRPTDKVRLVRVTREGEELVDDWVIREVLCSLSLDGQTQALFHCLPQGLEDLVTGWIKVKGFLDQGKAIDSIRIIGDPVLPDQFLAQVRLKMADKVEAEEKDLTPIPHLTLDQVSGLMEALESRARLFAQTGGSHNMLLASMDSLAILDHAEDISRHNCLYKLLGRAVREDRDLTEAILVTSCRLTQTILDLVMAGGIRLVISQAAVTSAALEKARQAGIQLIGFARPGRFNRYL